jgi:uncharacterized small protein (DUF1192 family)
MDIDDLEPLKPKPVPKNLEIMGIDEIQEYIAGLEAEIARARAQIEAKRGHRGAADSFFKT